MLIERHTRSLLILLMLPVVCLNTISNVTMTFTNGTSYAVFTNGRLESLFNSSGSSMNCVEPQTLILQQTPEQLANNAAYQITVEDNGNFTAEISTQYGHFTPTLNTSSCSGSCSITIWNNCPTAVTSSNYFDVLTIQLSGVPAVSYRVWCNQNYRPNTFQWGLFIIILGVTVLISLAAIYSKAWSLGGNGVNINYWIVGVLAILWIVGALMGAFIP